MGGPRCRRTVCLGQGFTLPPLQEEEWDTLGRPRSSSVVMGSQTFTLSPNVHPNTHKPMTTPKVNNIEKAEKMKGLHQNSGREESPLTDVEVQHNIENSQKLRAIARYQRSLIMLQDSDSHEKARTRSGEVFPGNTKGEENVTNENGEDEAKVSSGNEKHVTITRDQPVAMTTVVSSSSSAVKMTEWPRVRLSYVEPAECDSREESVDKTHHQNTTRKRSSWAAGEKHLQKILTERFCKGHSEQVSKAPPKGDSQSHDPVVLNNQQALSQPVHEKQESQPKGRKGRSMSREAATIFPRSQSCLNLPKCKKRLSWATSHRKRFSWSSTTTLSICPDWNLDEDRNQPSRWSITRSASLDRILDGRKNHLTVLSSKRDTVTSKHTPSKPETPNPPVSVCQHEYRKRSSWCATTRSASGDRWILHDDHHHHHHRRNSYAAGGDDNSRRPAIRMGTRSLVVVGAVSPVISPAVSFPPGGYGLRLLPSSSSSTTTTYSPSRYTAPYSSTHATLSSSPSTSLQDTTPFTHTSSTPQERCVVAFCAIHCNHNYPAASSSSFLFSTLSLLLSTFSSLNLILTTFFSVPHPLHLLLIPPLRLFILPFPPSSSLTLSHLSLIAAHLASRVITWRAQI